jgi:hypothetical protein
MAHRKSIKGLRLGLEPAPFTSRAHMGTLVEVLNPSDHPWLARVYLESEPELRRLVDLWRESGPNLYRFFEENREFKARAMNGQVILFPTRTGRAYLEWLPGSHDDNLLHPKEIALRQFMWLITNPEWESLGYCRRCNNYYLKRTKRQKLYCSQTCGSRTTAAAAVKTSRERDHKRKLERAQKYIDQWNGSPARTSWKLWVRSKTRYTLNWLTRAVNKGDLQAPTDGWSTGRRVPREALTRFASRPRQG